MHEISDKVGWQTLDESFACRCVVGIVLVQIKDMNIAKEFEQAK